MAAIARLSCRDGWGLQSCLYIRPAHSVGVVGRLLAWRTFQCVGDGEDEKENAWRTIGSSMVGYVFDTLPFVLIAFAGVVSTRELLLMLAFQYFAKLINEATMGTPMAYAVIYWVKRKTLGKK